MIHSRANQGSHKDDVLFHNSWWRHVQLHRNSSIHLTTAIFFKSGWGGWDLSNRSIFLTERPKRRGVEDLPVGYLQVLVCGGTSPPSGIKSLFLGPCFELEIHGIQRLVVRFGALGKRGSARALRAGGGAEQPYCRRTKKTLEI